jgi:hypothetical protein
MVKALLGSGPIARVCLEHLLQEILAFIADTVNVHANRSEWILVFVSQKHFLGGFPLEHVLAA